MIRKDPVLTAPADVSIYLYTDYVSVDSFHADLGRRGRGRRSGSGGFSSDGVDWAQIFKGKICVESL